MTEDDMFSSDLTDKELELKLGHLHRCAALFVFSGADEYVPDTVAQSVLGLRFLAAISSSSPMNKPKRSIVIDGANHSITDPEYAFNFVSTVMAFCTQEVDW